MSKRMQVLVIIFFVSAIIAVGGIFILQKIGYLSSQAATTPGPCPSGCSKHLSLLVYVKYNNSNYTKAPVNISGTSNNCNGPATGTPSCVRKCQTSYGHCSLDLCWVGNWVPYAISGSYTFSNGIKLKTNTEYREEYGGTPPVTLTAYCVNSAGTKVACP